MVVVWAGASNTGAAASADTGSRDSSILPVSRMLTMRLAFIGVRSFRVVFIRGSRYYKYTINWAKTKEILREWGLKLREWLKKEGKLKHCCPGTFSFDTKREPEKCQRFRRAGATKKGLLAPFNPKGVGYTGKN